MPSGGVSLIPEDLDLVMLTSNGSLWTPLSVSVFKELGDQMLKAPEDWRVEVYTDTIDLTEWWLVQDTLPISMTHPHPVHIKAKGFRMDILVAAWREAKAQSGL